MDIPKSRQLELPELSGDVDRMFSPVTHVEPTFRLLDASDQHTEDGVYEFYGKSRDAHMIMFNKDGNIGREHQALAERGVKVFSDMYIGDTTLLIVPEGARSVRGILRLIAHDIAGYGVVFEEIGQTVSQLEHARQGLPTHGKALDRFAYAPDLASASGVSVFLVPPYGLEHTQTADAFVENLQEELTQSDLLSVREQADLMGMVDNGRQRIG